MSNPVRLELNNTGAWKLLAKFDSERNREATDAILDAAHRLALAINDRACGRPATVGLRLSTDEPQPKTLMRWEQERGYWVTVTKLAQEPKP